MLKIWIIIQREYITRVKKPAFFITTLLAPLGFLVLMAASVFISTYNQSSTKVAIVDESQQFKALFEEYGLADADDGSVRFQVVTEKYDDVLKAMNAKEDAPFQAVLHIPENFDVNNPNHAAIAYRYNERPGMAKQQLITQRMNDAMVKLRMKSSNVDQALMDELQTKVKLNFESLKDSNENATYTTVASIFGMIMSMAIYISLFFYGTMIMKSVQEEKTNRIVEVLASSVKPFQLLMGKILGVGAVGITQIILWMGLMFVVNIVVGILFGFSIGSQMPAPSAMPAEAMDADDMNRLMSTISALPFKRIMILYPIYFLGGFLLYGSLFAAVGAAMGEDSDQQSLMLPISLPIIISVIIAMNVVNDPDSSLGFWASLIPFTSPVVMSAMLPLVNNGWQIAASLVLLVAGFLFTTFIAARIYRVGILMYGKKVKISEIMRWIFSKA
jgi:ABC-2 type transport system permease protein